MRPRNRMKNLRKKKPGNKKFWNKEYSDSSHLTLSTKPSEDLEKFTRWLGREYGYLNNSCSVLDLGVGNGRNLIFLAREFGVSGVGYDISEEAVSQAKKQSEGLSLSYKARSIAGPLNLEDESQDLVLDMMTSHFLKAQEREILRNEIYRVLKPGGWLFYKTFLLDEDLHAKRMLRDNPADEPGSYIHPEIGVPEHVSTEEEIIETLSQGFEIKKISKSFGHLRKGGAKRRSISVYAQKM